MQHLDMRDASQVSADMAKQLREERHHAHVAERAAASDAAVEDYEAALAAHGSTDGGGEVNETVIDALVKAAGRGDDASERAEQLDLPRGQRVAGKRRPASAHTRTMRSPCATCTIGST